MPNELELSEERHVITTQALNQGAVAIEQERAIAEAQGQLTLAKRFPRDLIAAHSELMSACKSKAFAEVAFYSVPNRGNGPSIRLAEEIARVYGNFQYGHRELSRDEGKSEVEVFAWDMEKNNRSIRQITVNHVQDTKNGPKVLRDQADIDNRIANIASKQVRGRILALAPKWLVQDAVLECRKTLAGNNSEPLEQRIRRMVQAFGGLGVTQKVIENWLGKPVAELTGDELVDLTGMFNAVKEGASAAEVFAIDGEIVEGEAKPKRVSAAEKLKAAKKEPTPGQTIVEGMEEAVRVAKGEGEPYAVHHVDGVDADIDDSLAANGGGEEGSQDGDEF
jgi:hypothetical protein